MSTASQAMDDFFRKALGDAYRQLPQGAALTPIEERGLDKLLAKWRSVPPEDRWLDEHWGVTTDRSDPEQWRLLPLTLATLDTFAERVWADPRDHDGSWSVAP